jgi:hypothetical protein
MSELWRRPLTQPKSNALLTALLVECRPEIADAGGQPLPTVEIVRAQYASPLRDLPEFFDSFPGN